MDFLITGKFVLTGIDGPGDESGHVITDGGVCVEGDEILAVRPAADLCAAYPGFEPLGGSDYVVMPGLTDAHQHGRGLTYFQRGVADESLELWLLALKSVVPLGDPYAGTALAALGLVAAGVTTVVHSHVTMNSQQYRQELLETLRAYQHTGLRTTFAVDVRDRGFFTYDDDATFLAGVSPELRTELESLYPVRSTPTLSAIRDRIMEARQIRRNIFSAQCPAALNQCQTVAAARGTKRAGLNFLSFLFTAGAWNARFKGEISDENRMRADEQYDRSAGKHCKGLPLHR